MTRPPLDSTLRAALEAWAISTLPRATAYARSLVIDRSTADDVVHECYANILARADVYDVPRDGTKILYRAITNAAINLTRSRRRVVTLEDEHADTHPTPDEHLAGREAAERVERGLRSLPVAQRAALELKSLGHSLQEIGEALETTANNAGVLVHRARQTLAAFLERGETS